MNRPPVDILIFGEALARTYGPSLEELGLIPMTADDLAAAESRLHSQPIAMLLSGIREPGSDFGIFDMALRLRPQAEGIAISAIPLAQAICEASARAFPRHFIASFPVDIQGLNVTARKLLTGEIFGMERYDVPAHEKLELNEDSSRYHTIDRVKEFFLGQGIAPRIVDKIEMALHELTMNAVRRRSEAGNQGPPVTLSYGIGRNALGVSVSDPCGDLRCAALFGAIRRAAVERSVVEAPGRGAGLGLLMVLKACGRLVVNVAPGRRTEVIALFHRANSLGESAKLGHSFHYFQETKHESQAEH